MFILDGLKVGGAQRHTVDLAWQLLARGVDVRLLLYSQVQSTLEVRPEILGRCVFLDFRKVLDLEGWLTVRGAILAYDANIVVAVNQSPTILAAGARLLGAPGRYISILHTTLLMPGLWDTRRFWLYRLALLPMTALLFVSRNQETYWRKRRLWCASRGTITNGVDLESFTASTTTDRDSIRSRLGFAPDDLVVGITASLRPEKNHVQLLEAVARLRARGISARCLVVGDGDTRGDIEAASARLGVAQAVTLVGAQSDVRPFVSAFDIGVLCSTAVETFSIAALEIMAMGVPMVMSDIGGASEIVRDGIDGRLFPVGDTDALVEALASFQSAERRTAAGRAAREGVARRHSENRMVTDYLALMERLLPPSAVAS